MATKVLIPSEVGVINEKPTEPFHTLLGQPSEPVFHPLRLITHLRQAFDEACQESEGRIEIRPQVFLGKPRLTGKRLAVYDVLYTLADTFSAEKTMQELEGLEREDIRAAILFAATVCEHEV